MHSNLQKILLSLSLPRTYPIIFHEFHGFSVYFEGGILGASGTAPKFRNVAQLGEGKGGTERACRGMRNARKEEFRALEGVIESHGGGPLAATRGP